nr:hypothetical protein pKpnC6_00107 [Klebsiella pneumoniae]UHP20970.1 hypothetical protein pEc5706_00206 [Escherichia coli]
MAIYVTLEGKIPRTPNSSMQVQANTDELAPLGFFPIPNKFSESKKQSQHICVNTFENTFASGQAGFTSALAELLSMMKTKRAE